MKKIFIAVGLLLVFVVFVVFVWQFLKVEKAHSTFENYYVFRGCTQLLKHTNSYAFCRTSSGQTIKLVIFRGKWYLDGDLPNCIFNICW